MKKLGCRKIDQDDLVNALEQIWEIYGRICSTRMHPFSTEGVQVLERCHELKLNPEKKQLFLRLSRATIDRCLKRALLTRGQHSLSTTKPGSIHKKAIPIRTFTPFEDEHPGFLEIDRVAHCGVSTEGISRNTLTATD